MINAKLWLEQIEIGRRIIDNKSSQIHQLRQQAYNVSIRMETCKVGGREYGMPRVTNSRKIDDNMAEIVAQYTDMETELQNDIREHLHFLREVNRTLEKLPPDSYDVLHKVYVQNLPLKVVAKQMHRSYTATTTLKMNAIRQLEELLNPA